MSTFRTILFAADFSERSRSPYRVACSLARHSQGRLIVLHAVVPVLFGEPSGPEGTPALPVFFPTDTPTHRAELTAQLRQFYPPCPSVAIEHHVRDGDAAEELLRAAHEIGAELIVLGTHGRSGLDRLLAGSVAETVLRRAECPVLAYRTRAVAAEEEPETDKLRLVLHPTDFSEAAKPALQVARSLAQDEGAMLLLLRVVPPNHSADLEHDWEALQETRSHLVGGGPGGSSPVEVRLVEGDPAAEIQRTAGEVGAGLIVMGTHGRTGLPRLLMGSVAETVVREAACPTLVVKARPHEPARPEP